jgi:hypothetical protein
MGFPVTRHPPSRGRHREQEIQHRHKPSRDSVRVQDQILDSDEPRTGQRRLEKNNGDPFYDGQVGE